MRSPTDTVSKPKGSARCRTTSLILQPGGPTIKTFLANKTN